MATQEPLPAPDSDFDILQGILVAAVIAHAAAWNIPAAEITKLTDKQTIWAAAWLIAKDKQNSTSAQKKAKDLARKAYQKVLRPFIQKWIYRNESMDAAAVEECGLKPRETGHTPATIPAQPVVTVKRGTLGELIPSCVAVPGAKHYGCIMTENGTLPEGLILTPDGKLVAQWDNKNMNMAQPQITGLQIDLTEQRIKHFTGLKHDATYYFYFYAVNAAGVSILSEVVSMVCW